MRQSLVSSTETRRTTKRDAPMVASLPGAPLTFLLTGFAWLGISFLVGIALIIGLVYGTPLPRWLKPVHVHGALDVSTDRCLGRPRLRALPSTAAARRLRVSGQGSTSATSSSPRVIA